MEKNRLEKKIAQLRGKSYISAELIDLLDAVTHLQLEMRDLAEIELPADNQLAPAEAVFQGMPLLGRGNFPYDARQAKTLLDRMITLLRDAGGPLGDGAAAVRAALDSGQLQPEELFQKFLEDDHAYFAPWAERMPEAPKTLSFLAFAALSPSIEAAARMLAEKMPDMKVPETGTCPICGSLPLISSLNRKRDSGRPPVHSAVTSTGSGGWPARSAARKTRRS